jgi:hypothetical protein
MTSALLRSFRNRFHCPGRVWAFMKGGKRGRETVGLVVLFCELVFPLAQI